MEAQRDSDWRIAHIPSDHALRRQHGDALLASTELHQSLLAPALIGSPRSLSQRSWAPVIQHNTPGWQQHRGTHVWDPSAAGHSHHGSTWVHSHTGSHGHGNVGSAAEVAQAGKSCMTVEATRCIYIVLCLIPLAILSVGFIRGAEHQCVTSLPLLHLQLVGHVLASWA